MLLACVSCVTYNRITSDEFGGMPLRAAPGVLSWREVYFGLFNGTTLRVAVDETSFPKRLVVSLFFGGYEYPIR